MVLLWLMGCTLGLDPLPEETASVDTQDPGVLRWSMEPDSIALGETPVDQPVSGVVTLTNTGDLDLMVFDLGTPEDDNLDASLLGAPVVPAGASTQVQVVWTPGAPGDLISALSISLGDSSDALREETVPVGGTALGAVATVSTSAYDFGEISIGCEADLTLTLTNTGNIDMQVDAVELSWLEGFSLDEPTDLPWVLSPYESHEQVVRFSPDDLGLMCSDLTFQTDLGEVATVLQGEGVVDEERTLTFDVGEQSRSTIIVDVNITAIPNSTEDQYSPLFVASLPTFFDTLLDSHTSFRAAFVWSVSGTVDGEYEYIDETFSSSEATEAALAMIEPGALAGDNDANFTTLLAAIDVNSDWLFEDDAWAASRLNLITIQRDVEASGGVWSNWVEQARAYKDDPEDLLFHALPGRSRGAVAPPSPSPTTTRRWPRQGGCSSVSARPIGQTT